MPSVASVILGGVEDRLHNWSVPQETRTQSGKFMPLRGLWAIWVKTAVAAVWQPCS